MATVSVVIFGLLIFYIFSPLTDCSGNKDWGMITFVSIVGGLMVGLAASLVTVPVVQLISFQWAWPLDHWPLWLQLGILIPLLFWFASTLAMIFIEREIFITIALYSLLTLFLVTPTVGIISLMPILPTVPEVGLMIIYGGFVLLFFSGVILQEAFSPLFDSDFEDISEMLILLSFPWLLISGITLGVILLSSISLWFLFAAPVALLSLAIASGAGEGGGDYSGLPGITWFISN